MKQIARTEFDGERLAATKAAPMPRAAIILLVSLAFALGIVTAHGAWRALEAGEHQHRIARV